MMVEASIAARILVAEDDAIVARDIREALEGLGYEVPGVVGSGEEAVVAARELDPDLVLMDIRMPDRLDGVEAADQIGEHVDVPVVYLTAYSDDRTVARAKQTAPFGYLVKPFDERELKTTVELALYRHRMERMVRQSRERYRRLFEDDIAAHYVSTPEGKILDANRAFADLLGADDVDAVLDIRATHLYPSDEDREEFLRQIREEGQIRNRRGELLRRDGRRVPVLENARAEFDDEGRLKEVHGNLIDMSRERRLEEQLRRSARMEAVGRVAGGVAHDFNNLLMAVRGTVDLVRTEESLSEQGREDLHSVLETCDRAAELVEDLLATGGGAGERRHEPVNLSGMVEGMYDVLSRLLGSGRELYVSVGGGPLVVEGAASQLEQVLLNLVVNARDAVPRGGRVTVRLEEAEDVDQMLPAAPDRAPGWLRLTVSDSGRGMDDETRKQIFDPFYTTKEEGTGMGLAAVYGIVREHGGDVLVRSEPGEGTTFQVYLPRSRGGAGALG